MIPHWQQHTSDSNMDDMFLGGDRIIIPLSICVAEFSICKKLSFCSSFGRLEQEDFFSESNEKWTC